LKIENTIYSRHYTIYNIYIRQNKGKPRPDRSLCIFGQQFWPDEKHICPTANQVRNAINVMLGHIKGLPSGGLAKKKWCDKSGNGRDRPENDGYIL